MDSLSSHKCDRVRRIIASRGAELIFLPPYSPELNPVEMILSKIKQMLRSIACGPLAELWDEARVGPQAITPVAAFNSILHSVYTLGMT